MKFQKYIEEINSKIIFSRTTGPISTKLIMSKSVYYWKCFKGEGCGSWASWLLFVPFRNFLSFRYMRTCIGKFYYAKRTKCVFKLGYMWVVVIYLKILIIRDFFQAKLELANIPLIYCNNLVEKCASKKYVSFLVERRVIRYNIQYSGKSYMYIVFVCYCYICMEICLDAWLQRTRYGIVTNWPLDLRDFPLYYFVY